MRVTIWERFREERARLRRPIIVAHRGNQKLEPENTLAAFRRAIDEGADALETDLRFTSDDQLILFHDHTLERTTDGSGPVRSHSLAQIKQLRTRRPGGQLSDERVPTLLEMLAMLGGEAPLLLELKDPLFLHEQHAHILVDMLRSINMLNKVALVSFHFDYVEAVKQVEPTLPIGFITLWNPFPIKRGAQMFGPLWPLLYLNPWYVRWAHRRQAIVAPLDPNPEPRVRYYLRRNVDAVLADHPASVLAALNAALGEVAR
jgi:glycerophosphoryl diester phosphodiesterase